MQNIRITYPKAFVLNLLGKSPVWYKNFIIACLVINPLVAYFSMFVAGWMLVVEFILTLAMALEVYPLEAGGLLVLEACFIGMCPMEAITHEIYANLEVILLLMFMVAGIHFVRDFLLFIFTKLLVRVRSTVLLSFLFCFLSGLISAFVDALTVLAIIIATSVGLYNLYVTTVTGSDLVLVSNSDDLIPHKNQTDVLQFRAFLRSILMSAAVGTTLGGVCTIVGEPQNLIIGSICGWNFGEFALRMMPVSIPVVLAGLLTCLVVQKYRLFGYGTPMPESVYRLLLKRDQDNSRRLSKRDRVNLVVQGLCCVWLIVALGFHLASVGLIGLSLIVIATSLCGVSSEGEIGKAFDESMPFCTLLCVFFTVVTIISAQKLFDPIIAWVLSTPTEAQLPIFYLANGLISSVSDNVFVATIYIEQIRDALFHSVITPEHFSQLAVAINAGTNLPSVATPNGQAAFLFLLTSPLAALIKLPYFRMMWMALPYTIVLTLVGLVGVWFMLPELNVWMIENNLIDITTLDKIAR